MKFPMVSRKEYDSLRERYDRCRHNLAVLQADNRNLRNDLEEERKRNKIDGSSREEP